MAYAGNDYGANGAWSGNAAGQGGVPVVSNLSTSHASGVIILASLAVLIAIRVGFRGVEVGGLNISAR